MNLTGDQWTGSQQQELTGDQPKLTGGLRLTGGQTGSQTFPNRLGSLDCSDRSGQYLTSHLMVGARLTCVQTGQDLPGAELVSSCLTGDREMTGSQKPTGSPSLTVVNVGRSLQ